jgi:uncharacterized membrane protein (UPF0136 family)
MKRIVSLDFLRGFAMIAMLGFHVLIHVSWHAQTSNYDDIFSSPLLPLFILIFLLANFRALFLMVSMTVYGYLMTKKIRGGIPASSILKKNLIFGIMLYFTGLFTEGLVANWGMVGRWIVGKDPFNGHIMHFETLNAIGLSIIFISIVFYMLSLKNGIEKIKRNIIILAVSAIIIIIISYLISWGLQTFNPAFYEEYYDGGQYKWNSVGEFFQKLILAAVMGLEQPIFPFFATACIGGIVGYLLAQEKVSSSLPKKGMLYGLLLIIVGVIVLALEGFSLDIDFNVFPTWFFLATTGIELILMMALLRMVEFSERVSKSKKMDRFIKKTIWVRRWSMTSLTLFIWQVYPEFLVRILGNIFSGGTEEFFIRGQLENGWLVILTIFLVIVLWDVIFRLWEKIGFKGTAEDIMARIGNLLSGKGRKVKTQKAQKTEQESVDKKIDESRQNIQKVLYEPEPITFV